jgi:hypothetical protein
MEKWESFKYRVNYIRTVTKLYEKRKIEISFKKKKMYFIQQLLLANTKPQRSVVEHA